jgi:hypothetical protein
MVGVADDGDVDIPGGAELEEESDEVAEGLAFFHFLYYTKMGTGTWLNLIGVCVIAVVVCSVGYGVVDYVELDEEYE